MSKLNNIKNNISKLFSLVLISVLTLSSSISYANETKNLKSGIYELKNDIYYESEIGMSMARNYTSEVMDLEYTKDKITYSVTFTGTDYMENYRILVNDKPVDFKIIEENKEETSITLSFEVGDIKDKISAQIYVDAMGRDVEFEVIPLVDTLNLIEEIQEVKEEVSMKQTNENNNEEVNNSSEKKSISPVAIGIGVVAILLVVFLIGKKK